VIDYGDVGTYAEEGIYEDEDEYRAMSVPITAIPAPVAPAAPSSILAQEPKKKKRKAAASSSTRDNEPKGQTLQELLNGPNQGAAQNEIDEIAFMIGVAYNFISLRLVISSGGQPPYLFDTETREYFQKYPVMNVSSNGNPMPAVFDNNPTATSDFDP